MAPTVKSSTGSLSWDSLTSHKGPRLSQRLFALLYTCGIAWRANESLRLVYLLQPVAETLRAVQLLILAAGYDACYGVAGVLPEGAATEPGCAGRDAAFRVLTLGRSFGLDPDADATFVWLTVALLVCCLASLLFMAWGAEDAPSSTRLKTLRILRAFLSLSSVVFLVPALLACLPYVTCRPDRPASYPCFSKSPSPTGVAAIVAAVGIVCVFSLVGFARVDLRRRSPDPSARHTGITEGLLPWAAAVIVASKQFLYMNLGARGYLQLSTTAALIAAPVVYFLPYHRRTRNYLHCAFVACMTTLFAALTALRARYGDTMAGATVGEAVGYLILSGTLGAFLGPALCALRYRFILKAYEEACARGPDARAFERPIDAVVAGRLIEERAAGGGPDPAGSSRSGPSVDVRGAAIVPIGIGDAGAASDREDRVEDVYVRAVRSHAGSPRVLLAAAAWALFSGNPQLAHQYHRRLADCREAMLPDTRYLAYALDRQRQEDATARGEETGEMHAALATARLHERRARIRIRAFWNLLLRDDLEVEKLPGAVALIESSKSAASEIYRRVERRFPNSARAARCRAAFLQEFELDLEGAAQLLARGQAIEEQQAAAARAAAAAQRRQRAVEGRRRESISEIPARPSEQRPGLHQRRNVGKRASISLDALARDEEKASGERPASPVRRSRPPSVAGRGLTRMALAEHEAAGAAAYSPEGTPRGSPRRGSVPGLAALEPVTFVPLNEGTPKTPMHAREGWEFMARPTAQDSPLLSGQGESHVKEAARVEPEPEVPSSKDGAQSAGRSLGLHNRRDSAMSARSSVHLQQFRALISGHGTPAVGGMTPKADDMPTLGMLSPRASACPSPAKEEGEASATIAAAPGGKEAPAADSAAAAAAAQAQAIADATTIQDQDESAMSVLLARRFYRQQLTAKSGRVAGRVGLSLAATIVICAVFLSAFYGAARYLSKSTDDYVELVASAASFSEYAARVALCARSAFFAAQFATPLRVTDVLTEWAGIGRELFAKRSILTSSAARLGVDANLVTWADGFIDVRLFNKDAEPPTWVERQHPQDALTTFIRRTSLVLDLATASFVPSLLPDASPIRAGISAGEYANASAYRFVVDNIEALRRAGESMQDAVLADTTRYMRDVPNEMGATFGVLFGVLVLASVASFALAARAVRRERRGALLLFNELPRATVKEIRNGISASIALAPVVAPEAVEKPPAGGAPEAAPSVSFAPLPPQPPVPRPAAPQPPGLQPVPEAASARADSEAPQSTSHTGGATGAMAVEEALSVDFIEAEFVHSVQAHGQGRATARLVGRASAALLVALLFPIGMLVAIQLLFQESRGAMEPTATVSTLRSVHPELALWSQELVAARLAPTLALGPPGEVQARLRDALDRFGAALEGLRDTVPGAMDDGGDDCGSLRELLTGDGATGSLAASSLDAAGTATACLSLRQHMVEASAAARTILQTRPDAFRWSSGPLAFVLQSVNNESPASAAVDDQFAAVVGASNGRIATALRAMDAIFAIGVVLMGLCWLVFLRPAIRAIAWEHETTLSMLLMIPPSVIDKIPAVRDYMAAAESYSTSTVLADSRAKTKSLLEAASDAIVVCDAAGSIQVFNRAAEQLLGYTADEALAMRVDAILGDDVLPKAGEGADEAGGAAASFSAQRDILARRKDGGRFPSQVSVGAGQSGRRPYFVLFIRDVTERRAGEAALQAEKARADLLLRNILPDPIVERLKGDTEDIIADAIDEATVLFSDLVGFTAMCSAISPEETVGLLSELFNRFDELLEAYGVDKVKTIGDAYMAFTVKPAETMIDFALDMVGAVQAMNVERGTTLNVRVGIHTGPIVAGVIGTKRLAYDIWGDTVNTASRMESSGVPGRVNISPSTYERVRYKFGVDEPRAVEVKGKGQMTTYLVKGRTASFKYPQARREAALRAGAGRAAQLPTSTSFAPMLSQQDGRGPVARA